MEKFDKKTKWVYRAPKFVEIDNNRMENWRKEPRGKTAYIKQIMKIKDTIRIFVSSKEMRTTETKWGKAANQSKDW